MAALVCTAAYLAGGIEALPQALALGVWAEGSHNIRLASDQHHLWIILSHERDVARPADQNPRPQSRYVQHQHGLAARIICLFDSHPSANGDHVGQFSSNQVCENSARAAKRKADDTSTSKQPALAVAANAHLPPEARLLGVCSCGTLPEPAARLCLVLTSSTLLTI
jgi:hypothetical protein